MAPVLHQSYGKAKKTAKIKKSNPLHGRERIGRRALNLN